MYRPDLRAGRQELEEPEYQRTQQRQPRGNPSPTLPALSAHGHGDGHSGLRHDDATEIYMQRGDSRGLHPAAIHGFPEEELVSVLSQTFNTI